MASPLEQELRTAALDPQWADLGALAKHLGVSLTWLRDVRKAAGLLVPRPQRARTPRNVCEEIRASKEAPEALAKDYGLTIEQVLRIQKNRKTAPWLRGKWKKLDDADRRHVLDRLDEPIPEICTKVGCRPGQVKYLRRQLGFAPARKRLTHAQIASILDGFPRPAAEVAKDHGVDPKTVSYHWKKAGLWVPVDHER